MPSIGEELAFQSGYSRGSWRIHTITRITPSGRIECGPYTLNPDLTVRGRSGYGTPFRGEPVTAAIRASVQRDEDLSYVQTVRFHAMSDLSLRRVACFIRDELAQQEDS